MLCVWHIGVKRLGNDVGAELVSHVEKEVLGPGSLRGGAVYSAWLWFRMSGDF